MTGYGIIESIKGNKARVKVTSQSECAVCSGKDSCMSNTYTDRQITVLNELGAVISDKVVFEAEPGKVVFSAVLIWVLPVLAMIVGYMVGKQFGGGFLPVGAAFVFLGLTYLFLKILDNVISGGKTFYPRVIAVVDSFEDAEEYCGKR
jgi:sigma-E factor negative regulatory protein RseC